MRPVKESIQEKTLRALEFNRIKEQIAEFSYLEHVKNQILKLAPTSDISYINAEIDLVDEGVKRINRIDSPNFIKFSSIDYSLSRLKNKLSLDKYELWNIREILTLAINMSKYEGRYRHELKDAIRPSALYEIFDKLEILDEVLEIINGSLAYGNITEYTLYTDAEPVYVKDNASALLLSLRKKRKEKESSVYKTLDSLIRKNSSKLMEDTWTLKEGHYCLMVRLENKKDIQGILVGQSQSRQSFFIEPYEVADIVNEIRKIESDEEREIDNILNDISQKIMPYAINIESNYNLLSKIDFVFAKAEYSIKHKLTRPNFINSENDHASEYTLNLINARHLLIDSSVIVPQNIYMKKGIRQLIITGPNTGGKTVALKTLGLCSLLAQSGMFIPCSDNSSLPMFNKIYADIGDEQSIEQSLSTFSSHMTNLISIINNLEGTNLILLDELGGGTDPSEGSALAISILKYLLEKKQIVAATTHYPEIKIYALNEEGVSPCACEFDNVTFAPTYRLIIGTAAGSNALSISKRLGLKEELIENAKKGLSKDENNLFDIINKLNEEKRLIEKEKEEIAKIKKDALVLKETYETSLTKFNEQKNEMVNKARDEAKAMIRNTKAQIRETLKEVENAESINMLEKSRGKLNEFNKELGENIFTEERENKEVVPIDKIKEGMKVYATTLGTTCTVVSLPDKDGIVKVRLGTFETRAHASSLQYP